MKAIIDKESCMGCELCVDICPEVFEMAGNVAKAKISKTPQEYMKSCREAAKECPVDAISIE